MQTRGQVETARIITDESYIRTILKTNRFCSWRPIHGRVLCHKAKRSMSCRSRTIITSAVSRRRLTPRKPLQTDLPSVYFRRYRGVAAIRHNHPDRAGQCVERPKNPNSPRGPLVFQYRQEHLGPGTENSIADPGSPPPRDPVEWNRQRRHWGLSKKNNLYH